MEKEKVIWGLNLKYILAFFLILISLSNFSIATPYDIETDLDVNQFEASDYLDLTQAGVGEGLRTTAKNTEFILAIIVIGALAVILITVLVMVLKKR